MPQATAKTVAASRVAADSATAVIVVKVLTSVACPFSTRYVALTGLVALVAAGMLVLAPHTVMVRRGKFLFCRYLRRIGGIPNIPQAWLRRTFRRSDRCSNTQRGRVFGDDRFQHRGSLRSCRKVWPLWPAKHDLALSHGGNTKCIWMDRLRQNLV
jgi:hypothetical protein